VTTPQSTPDTARDTTQRNSVPDSDALLPLRQLATQIAIDAGAYLLAGIDNENITVDTKSTGTDMVSEMDRGAEALIVKAILAARPNDALLGEEGTSRPGTTGYRWVIDPLDGTTNFLYRHPLWSVSIGVEYEGVPVVGVVNAPMLNMLFSAHTGGGATRNDTRLQVGSCESLGFALVGTGFGYQPEMRKWQGEIVHALLPIVRDLRRGGSAAIDLCFVAAGNYDGYYERNLNPWDACAGTVIVREAGGIATNLTGGEPDLAMTIAGNPYVHESLQAQLQKLITE
jgi:myo-inositol-1(or 4)-monophosphatase